MGRKSREKRERRARVTGAVAQTASGFSRASLLALLEAASVSPNASQYLPSLSVIFESLANRTRPGDVSIAPTALASLVEGARQEVPAIVSQQDFLPHDPRFDVRVLWANEFFRIAAGTLERPTSDVETLRRLAKTIDPTLIECIGYGLADIIELILRRINAVVATLAPFWDMDQAQVLGASPEIQPNEHNAALNIPPLEDQIRACSHPDRTRIALQAHSVPAHKLRRDDMSLVATFGSTVCVRHGHHKFTPLPAGLLPEAVNAIAGELAQRALDSDPTLEARWRRSAREFVGYVLSGAGNDLSAPIRDQLDRSLHSIVRYSDAHYLIVSVAAGLRQESIASAAQRLGKARPGDILSTSDGTFTIPASAKLSRLLIVAQPQAAILNMPPCAKFAAITLQDFDWIRRTIGHDEIDLWYFARDLTERRRIKQLFAWDVIDLWETWRSGGKTLYCGARNLDLLNVQPHHSIVEWQKAAEHLDIEITLHQLGLGSVTAWPRHDLEGSSKIVGNVLSGRLYRLVLCPTPVAVALASHSESQATDEISRNLGNCIAHKIESTAVHFAKMMQSNERLHLRIEFTHKNVSHVPPLQVADVSNGVLTFECASNLEAALQDNSAAVEALIGTLLSEAINEGPCRTAFVEQWNIASPGIRMDAIDVGPRLQRTPEPTSLHEAHRSAYLADLGAHLDAIGIQAGIYSGDRAKRLESETIFLWLTKRLREELAIFNPTTILRYALTQLEYANCHRWWKIKKAAFPIGSPTDEESGLSGSDENFARQARFISLMIEEILAHPPCGSKQPTEYDWQQLLSLATLCGESGNRSEFLHLGLATYSLVVGDDYSVSSEDSEFVESIDLDAFYKDRSAASLPDAKPIGSTTTSTANIDPPQEWTSIGARLPDFQDIENCLRGSLGFGLDATAGILYEVIRWPVSLPDYLARVDPDQIVERAYATNPLISRTAYAEATVWLSIGTEDFDPKKTVIEHWEVEARSARVAHRPIVRDQSKVWISPWTAQTARRIWENYLSERRLPRANSDLPSSVVAALDKARQARNTQFEDECSAALNTLQLTKFVRIREKHAQAHGINELSGEIDILCIDPRRSMIFVIEAKDPLVPLSPRSIHKQISRFHKEGAYVDKLLKKCEDIESSSVSLATMKDIKQPNRQWKIVGLMVTRHVTPSAYLKTCPVRFCTVDTLFETVASWP